jgi:hypothetical protein
MIARLAPGAVLAILSVPAVVISGHFRPILGGAFAVTVFFALALNGCRGTLASMRVRPADADDPVSPAAIART